MAQFSNYTDLQTACQTWTWNRNTSMVPDFIYLAHQQINARLRVPAMQKSGTITIDANSETVPSDLQAVKKLWIDGSFDAPLTPQTPENLQALRAAYTADQPRWYAIEGADDTTDVFQFAPGPAASYTAYLTYYRRLAFFASGSETNKVLTRHPQLYLWGAALEAARYESDAGLIAQYEGLFNTEIERLNMLMRADALSGGVLLPASPYTV